MAYYHTWTGSCPHCKKTHDKDFVFYSPSDGDEDSEGIECDCGCLFEITACAEVDVYIQTLPIKIIALPNPDINSEEYHSNDPNQLSLL